MKVLAKIEGNGFLLRDMKTGAIINTSNAEFEAFMERKLLKDSQEKRLNNIEIRLLKIEQLLEWMSDKKYA